MNAASIPTRAKLILAMDAGATTTRALLTDLQGNEFGHIEGPSLNVRHRDKERFRKIVIELFSELQAQADAVGLVPDAVTVGAAGAGSKRDRVLLREVLQNRWASALVLVHHDAYIAQYGAFNGGPGVIVTAGTGSIAYGRNEKDEEIRSGGWGWMLGDEGSAWWIAREAVRAVLRAHEGGPETGLTEKALAYFQVEKPYDIFTIVYKARYEHSKLNDLSKEVTALAEEGDEVSRAILHQAGVELGRLGTSCAHRLGIPAEQLEVALMGGVGTGAYNWLQPGVMESLHAYAGRPVEQEKPHSLPMEMRDLPDVPVSEDEIDKITPSPAGEPTITPQFPDYPPRDLTPESEVGPRLILPRMDALRGAAQWARDEMLKRKFA
ncbi:hypothetical protein GF324_13885 [bacterium]|nr:hypothetical protein [bacterium]